MDDQKQHVIDSLKQANNILITVKNSPSVDQLAACIALTLIVNDLDKHGTAVFSGQVPSVLEFLEPEKTIERNTDSLRDFIISLDKAKADKLRYKVEDTVVKVFITPYRTSLSAEDLEFGQGDFNVDVVVALGVHNQDDLDEAITAHGRILHDATVISINTEGGPSEDLGSINWVDTNVSSLSEMVFGFADKLGKEDVVDNQIATALLTGIVAETERFGNSKTKPATMEVAAKLLAAGANQELVAAKLAEPIEPETPDIPRDDERGGDGGAAAPPNSNPEAGGGGGELAIEHPSNQALPDRDALEPPQTSESPTEQPEQPFAKEDAAFDVPQEDFTNNFATSRRPVEGADDRAEDRSPGEVPPVFDPSQVDAAPTEEQQALDYLKERKVDIGSRAKIEPLHGQDEILETPRIVPEPTKPEAEAPGVSEDDKLNTRFALTPPSLGGTLTANMPDERDTATVESMLEKQHADGPLLSHGAMSAATEEAVDQDKQEESTHDTHDKSQVAASDQPPLDAAPLPASVPEPRTQAEAAKPLTTLEDLEKQVHAHETDSSDIPTAEGGDRPVLQAVPQGPPPAPSGAKDMPAPPSIKLPMPQEISFTGSGTPSPLAPPPPVPPPLPHS